ncbi:MAG TPA: sugar-transfer associated ATP-grasp domain-containing protein [Hyphomicrobiaceae bacterium]|jgi:hypothetical protein|nr:sugar-transfer associated ATP-grasp domain-containing protein [Hyphomicrobiaceae bacterium]
MSEAAARYTPVPEIWPSPPVPVRSPAPKAGNANDLASSLRTIAADYKKTYQQVLLDMARASFGPGRLTCEEYVFLRLFDEVALGRSGKAAFVGAETSHRIWATANFRSEWWGVMRNRLAVATLLGGYGFPMVPLRALYSDTLCLRTAPLLRTRVELEVFLRDAVHYPLFGKPVAVSPKSVGSICLESYDDDADCVVLPCGDTIAVDQLVTGITQNAKPGYLFQQCLQPHSRFRELAGDRLVSSRIITICTERGPELLRTLLRIPFDSTGSARPARDSYLLAKLDCQAGRIVRVTRGTGLALKEVTGHPDTGATLVGAEIPHWTDTIELALEAAAALKDVPLVGWDIAATESGPMILEATDTPDFFTPQLVDRRGMLNKRFTAFLETCKAARKRCHSTERFGAGAAAATPSR